MNKRKRKLKNTKGKPGAPSSSGEGETDPNVETERAFEREILRNLSPESSAALQRVAPELVWPLAQTLEVLSALEEYSPDRQAYLRAFDEAKRIEIENFGEDALDSFIWLYQECASALLTIAHQCGRRFSDLALARLIDVNVATTRWLNSLDPASGPGATLRRVSLACLEWPTLRSVFRKETQDYEKRAASLPLGQLVKLKIAPQKTNASTNRLAIRVLHRIEEIRCRPNHPFFELCRALQRKSLCKEHVKAWQLAAEKFMDLTMAPVERRRITAGKLDLEAEWQAMERSYAEIEKKTGRKLRTTIDACGIVSEIPEFWKRAEGGNKAVSNASSLYNKVRGEVKDAIFEMAPEIPE